MAWNTEIFNQKEKEILDERKNQSKITPEQYSKLLEVEKEKIEKYVQIDNALDNLESNASLTVEQKLDKKIKLIEDFYKKEKNPKITTDKIKQKAEQKIKSWLDKTEKKVLDKMWLGKLWEVWEKISGFFDKVSKAFDKGFLVGLWVLFGFVKYEDIDKKDWKGSKEEKKESKVETKPETPEEYEKLKKAKNWYYKSWKFLVKNLLDEQFSSKDNFGTIIDNTKNTKYSDIKNLEYKKDFWWTKENFEKMKRNLLGEDMRVLYDNILTKENFEKLKENKKINKIILELWIDTKNFYWKNLNIEQLFSLLSIIVSSSVIIWLKAIPWIWESVLNKIFSLKDNIPWFSEIESSIKQEIDNFEKEVIDKATTKEILSINNIWESSSFNWEEENFNSIKNKEKVKQLLNFRDFILKDIIENNKYNLWQENLIKQNISFRNVLELFISFKWEKNIDNLKSSIIYTWIIKILKKWNDYWAYLNNLWEEIKKENSDILKKEEQKLLKVVLKKVIDKTWFNNLKQRAETIKDITVEHVKNNKEIVAWIAWIALVLRFTPAWRVVSVLYSLVGKKWMTILASAWVFTYFYKQLDVETKNSLLSYKEKLKEYDLDLDKLIPKN